MEHKPSQTLAITFNILSTMFVFRRHSLNQWFLYLLILSFVSRVHFVSSLVQTTWFHQLYLISPMKHSQLHFLNEQRLEAPELIFWNGLGAVGESVFIIAEQSAMEKYKSEFESHNLTVELTYDTVKITYVAHNPEHPNEAKTETALEPVEDPHLNEDDDNEDDINFMTVEDEMDQDMDETPLPGHDHKQAENFIRLRKAKLGANQPPGDILLETVASSPRGFGLLPVTTMKSYEGKKLPIHSGIFYRIQGMQTLIVGNATTVDNGEWTGLAPGTGNKVGYNPRVGEFLGSSQAKRRSGANPFVTSEENPHHWKNTEHLEQRTKSVLWMFIPTEYDKFYEIRNRNYPMSLLVWSYDIDEGEFILHLETRRQYLKRYQPEGVLRYRALFSFQLVSSPMWWELRKGRPKYRLITFNANHVYLYESQLKGCTVLAARNSGSLPYTPEKTDMVGRSLDMFYITRTGLSGEYTASIFSFMFDKSIVDIFAESAANDAVDDTTSCELFNRGPVDSTQYIVEQVPSVNSFKFNFKDKFTNFQWVAIESQLPSFGIPPIIIAGAIGNNTDTKQIEREIKKMHSVEDKVVVEPGHWINASVYFQFIDNFNNPFTALMEITEPADRLYIGRNGKPKFIRFSLPGDFIEHNWESKANFKYERVIEKREAALVVQVHGNLIASYGLRLFAKKVPIMYSVPIVNCEDSPD